MKADGFQRLEPLEGLKKPKAARRRIQNGKGQPTAIAYLTNFRGEIGSTVGAFDFERSAPNKIWQPSQRKVGAHGCWAWSSVSSAAPRSTVDIDNDSNDAPRSNPVTYFPLVDSIA